MRRRPQSHLVFVSVLIWVLAIGGFFVLTTQEGRATDAEAASTGHLVAQQYIENALPVISRGTTREVAVQVVQDGSKPSQSLKGLVDRTFPFLIATHDEKDNEPSAQQIAKEAAALQIQREREAAEQAAREAAAKKEAEKKAAVAVVDTAEGKNPQVLIVHTHATESYQPVNIGNFHATNEKGTVREVGNELTKALEAKGIAVIHDKTLHDHPSYNQSYGRSLQTVQNYLKKNTSIKIVIDLHRDAASYSGNMGKTANIKGNVAATYSLVIGKGNANVEKLRLFANRINVQADILYPGLGGRIIEKEYRFNEYVCDQYLLLEIGNNENTIDQAKLTGTYFADILEAYLKNNPK